MSVYRKFASISYPDKFGYIFDTAASYQGHRAVCDKFLMFETYGDRTIQHSHEVPIQPEYLPDYIASAIVLMLQDAEFAKDFAYYLDRKPTRALIKFALSIRYKEGKRQYYSLAERKVSANPKLQHDRRYEEVPDWADGSGEAAHKLIMRNQEFADGIEFYSTAQAIHDYLMAEDCFVVRLARGQ